MAVASDVRIAEDGGQNNIKLHPYLVALVRWCMSCLWSTATVLLHRLMVAPLPPIAASKPPPKARTASTDHLHPEPLVECVVLHTPSTPKLDVIFVHGLYGSLGNTWRQGDWRPKYKIEPNKVPLINPKDTICKCDKTKCNINEKMYDGYESNVQDINCNEDFYSKMKILPNENIFITENFYNNAILDQVEIVDNYEVQANFVRDLFKKECGFDNKCKTESEVVINESEVVINESEVVKNESDHCECKLNESRVCEIGCGCVCDECYSTCWPKDWIKVDYPDARVISINYTSDPYLWRPLWVKENKRLRLHERAEQMSKQLLDMGVGKRPIIWVGHSKGGLFIKQIYCEAYEAYLRTKNDNNNKINSIKNGDNNHTDNDEDLNETDDVLKKKKYENNLNEISEYEIDTKDTLEKDYEMDNRIVKIMICDNNNDDLGSKDDGRDCDDENDHRFEDEKDESSLNDEEDVSDTLRASLWTNSAGFMFYSVPHRGSPLADIKTPITARSIELLEISKDCALVLSLQERWLQATSVLRPAVRSLVETTRTLMSVLWLRIVSVHSADAGIGALYGVSVDHREICKPSSRHCLLYIELMNLMRAALNKCKCQ